MVYKVRHFLRNKKLYRALVSRVEERVLFHGSSRKLKIEWVKKGRETTWLFENLYAPLFEVPDAPAVVQIELLAQQTNSKLGSQLLWEGYGQPNAIRTPNQVRTQRGIGCFFAWLVNRRWPSIVVEFGAAFGVSGMYWLSGLEANQHGELLTFEPNHIWAEIAYRNLAQIGSRFQLVTGTFEENIDSILGDRLIDIAFIDAIHTSEFVLPQFELVVDRLRPGGLILLDDIGIHG